jgi:hypothetical protein
MYLEGKLVRRNCSRITHYTGFEYRSEQVCSVDSSVCFTLFIAWPVPLSENAFVPPSPPPSPRISRVGLNNFLSTFFANLFEFFSNFSFPEYLSRKLTKFRLFFANCWGKRRKSSTIFGFRSISFLAPHLLLFIFNSFIPPPPHTNNPLPFFFVFLAPSPPPPHGHRKTLPYGWLLFRYVSMYSISSTRTLGNVFLHIAWLIN